MELKSGKRKRKSIGKRETNVSQPLASCCG
jgi:hypothetical protein